ncbi:hypothetical protein D3C72_1418270 [compost metagenome]
MYRTDRYRERTVSRYQSTLSGHRRTHSGAHEALELDGDQPSRRCGRRAGARGAVAGEAFAGLPPRQAHRASRWRRRVGRCLGDGHRHGAPWRTAPFVHAGRRDGQAANGSVDLAASQFRYPDAIAEPPHVPRAFAPGTGPGAARCEPRGHPVHRPRPFQGSQRHARPPPGRYLADRGGAAHPRGRARDGYGGAPGRR